jgi:hypothetical protein
MNSTPPTQSLASGTTPYGDKLPAHWPEDDDIAWGCECANPALQIERWGQEVPQPTAKSY